VGIHLRRITRREQEEEVVEVVEVVEGRATVEPPVEWLRGGWSG